MFNSASADYLAASLGPNFFDSNIYRYDPDGAAIPSPGTPFIPTFSGGLGFAQGITVGPDGNIYVSSTHLITGAGEVLFFDPSGNPLSHEGGQPGVFATLPPHPEPGEDEEPTSPSPAGLTFGADGNLYVADRQGTTVRKFDGQSGAYLDDAATDLITPTGVAFGPDGALYVTNFNAGTVERFVDGVKDEAPFIAPGFVTPMIYGPQTPSSLLWLSSGNVLVVDVIGNQVLEYDGAGEFVRQFAVPPPSIPGNWSELANFPTNSPSQVIFDEDGNLVLALLGLTNQPDDDGALLRYDLEGNLLETMTTDAPGVGGLVFIKAAGALAGDFDGDDDVDENDYLKWRADYGKWVAKGGGADGNGDGIVDGADYTVWRNHYVEGGGGQLAGPSPIPEPTSATLLALGLTIMCLGRRNN